MALRGRHMGLPWRDFNGRHKAIRLPSSETGAHVAPSCDCTPGRWPARVMGGVWLGGRGGMRVPRSAVGRYLWGTHKQPARLRPLAH